jgi:hypothetical protein
MMLQIGKEYRTGNNHRVCIAYEKDDKFVGVNLFDGDLDWYFGDGTCTTVNEPRFNLVMPMKLEIDHIYSNADGDRYIVKHHDGYGNYWAAKLGQACNGSWFYEDGRYYRNEETSHDLIKEIF